MFNFSYDEPYFKSKFNFQIRHHVNFSAISSTPELSRILDESDENYVITSFRNYFSQSHNKFPVHVNCFIITSLPFIGSSTVYPYHRIFFAKSSIAENLKFALGLNTKFLITLQELTKYPSFLPKFDKFVLKNNNNKNHLEDSSFGMAIYDETDIIYDESFHGLKDRDKVIKSLAHKFTVCFKYYSSSV